MLHVRVVLVADVFHQLPALLVLGPRLHRERLRIQTATCGSIGARHGFCSAGSVAPGQLRFPLLSDFESKSAVAKSYGVYRNQDG